MHGQRKREKRVHLRLRADLFFLSLSLLFSGSEPEERRRRKELRKLVLAKQWLSELQCLFFFFSSRTSTLRFTHFELHRISPKPNQTLQKNYTIYPKKDLSQNRSRIHSTYLDKRTVQESLATTKSQSQTR